jgi:hypothetical protein
MRFRLFLELSLVIFLCGCATQSTVFLASIETSIIEQRIKDSPIVEHLTQTDYQTVLPPMDIGLYYKKFHILNRPDKIENWEYYYVLGEASSPSWKYIELANISVYLARSDNDTAIQTMKTKASEIGGSAIINLYKKPLTNRVTKREMVNYSLEIREQRPIEGYIYYGTIVRKIEAKSMQPTVSSSG